MGINFNIKLPSSKTEEVINLYEKGHRISAIAEKFSVSPGTIRNRLKYHGIIIKPDNLPHNWKGGRRKTAKGYILIYSPDHPRAVKTYVFEHILVWETVSGRPLPKGFIIHHLNGIKDDNRFENLFATTKNEHHRLFEPYRQKIRELEEENKRLNIILYGGMIPKLADPTIKVEMSTLAHSKLADTNVDKGSSTQNHTD